mgnify:CR=1 FL=1
MVVDIGGGTTDISLLDKSDSFYKVLYNKGDLFLGGNDFTKEISDNLNISMEEAEKRKQQNLKEDVKYYQNNLDKLENIIKKIIDDNPDKINLIEDVILVGNGLKLYGIRQLFEKYFKDKKKISIVDFGGRIGIGFFYLSQTLDKKLDYTIIEITSYIKNIGLHKEKKIKYRIKILSKKITIINC